MPPPLRCPWCAADLKGEAVPEKFRELLGGAEFYSRVLPVRNSSDVILGWQCPSCGRSWLKK